MQDSGVTTMTRNHIETLAGLIRNGFAPETCVPATLDVAYLVGNLDGWFTEKQDRCFESIASGLGKKPADVSPDAVGLNAKLAHLRGRISEEEFLNTFLAGVRPVCETLGRTPGFPVRRAFALWLAISLADGAISPVCRKALESLQQLIQSCAIINGGENEKTSCRSWSSGEK